MRNYVCAINTRGHHTDIVLYVYSNRVFLIVTHFNKIGTLVTVNHESSLNQFNSKIFSTRVLFGKDDIHITAAARYIAEQIKIDRPLLLSISLKDYDPDTVKPIIAAIRDLNAW